MKHIARLLLQARLLLSTPARPDEMEARRVLVRNLLLCQPVIDHIHTAYDTHSTFATPYHPAIKSHAHLFCLLRDVKGENFYDNLLFAAKKPSMPEDDSLNDPLDVKLEKKELATLAATTLNNELNYLNYALALESPEPGNLYYGDALDRLQTKAIEDITRFTDEPAPTKHHNAELSLQINGTFPCPAAPVHTQTQTQSAPEFKIDTSAGRVRPGHPRFAT